MSSNRRHLPTMDESTHRLRSLMTHEYFSYPVLLLGRPAAYIIRKTISSFSLIHFSSLSFILHCSFNFSFFFFYQFYSPRSPPLFVLFNCPLVVSQRKCPSTLIILIHFRKIPSIRSDFVFTNCGYVKVIALHIGLAFERHFRCKRSS